MIPANERHDPIVETAERWGISVDLARDTFRDEPGVLKFVRPGTRVKRSYCTLRVPESVLARVYARLTSRPWSESSKTPRAIRPGRLYVK